MTRIMIFNICLEWLETNMEAWYGIFFEWRSY